MRRMLLGSRSLFSATAPISEVSIALARSHGMAELNNWLAVIVLGLTRLVEDDSADNGTDSLSS